MFTCRFNVLLCLAVLTTSCVDKTFDESIAETAVNECTLPELKAVSDTFLKGLLNDDLDEAVKVYAKNHRVSGPGYGLNYTFFPHRDPEAVFDIRAKHKESVIFTEDLGAFEKGRLVGFFQSSASGQTQNITYLRGNHWKTFAVCNFVCIDGDWLISDHTCFEDSGSPFE